MILKEFIENNFTLVIIFLSLVAVISVAIFFLALMYLKTNGFVTTMKANDENNLVMTTPEPGTPGEVMVSGTVPTFQLGEPLPMTDEASHGTAFMGANLTYGDTVKLKEDKEGDK